MKKILIFITIIIITLSCDDNFLDRSPYHGLSDANIWKSETNAKMAINGVYSSLSLGGLYDLYYYTANIGPDGYTLIRAVHGLSQAIGTATPRDARFLDQYSLFYKTIRYANDAIVNLEKSQGIEKEVANIMIGEARFLRGLSYFYLLNLYGGVILLDRPVDPSETYLPRNSAEEVKNFIINDFTDAIEKLPIEYTTGETGRATKGAAIAMLGKTYLYDKQWEKAEDQFEKLMDAPFSYNLVEDYSDLFNHKTQPNSESIFDLQFIMVEGYGSTFDMRYGTRSHHMQGQDYSDASHISAKVYTYTDGSIVDWSTMPKLSNYENTLEYGKALLPWYDTTFINMDERLHKNIILPGRTFVGRDNISYKLYYPYSKYLTANPPPIRTTFGDEAVLPWRKFVTTGTDNSIRFDSPVDYPLIRYGDVLLMYAEAKNEASGPSAEVYSAINEVRNRAGVVDLAEGHSKDELRRDIWLERFRELMAEGHLYFDVKRWNTAHTNDPVFGLNHDVLDYRGEKLYTKVFKEKDYLWPIPAQEREINQKLIQNPDW